MPVRYRTRQAETFFPDPAGSQLRTQPVESLLRNARHRKPRRETQSGAARAGVEKSQRKASTLRLSRQPYRIVQLSLFSGVDDSGDRQSGAIQASGFADHV